MKNTQTVQAGAPETQSSPYNFTDTVQEFHNDGFRAWKLSNYGSDPVLLMVQRKSRFDVRVVAVRNDGCAFGLATPEELIK